MDGQSIANSMKINQLAILAALSMLAACNLTKDVEINLPAYESQPVVECYLEAGQPMTLLLTKSSPYFEPLGKPEDWLAGLFLDSALVTISYPTGTDTLKNQLFFNPVSGKVSNYFNPTIVQPSWGIDYRLKIVLKNGQEIEAKTTLLQPTKIDSLVVEWKNDGGNSGKDTLARVLTYITDDLDRADFYRRTLHIGSLDSLQQDFWLDDRLFASPVVAFGTGYEFAKGDTVFNTIFKIDKPYFDYRNSVEVAVQANFNPFGQPSQIRSNVSGSANPIGIFTGLSFERRRTIIQ